jgi:hypothetical protein
VGGNISDSLLTVTPTDPIAGVVALPLASILACHIRRAEQQVEPILAEARVGVRLRLRLFRFLRVCVFAFSVTLLASNRGHLDQAY